MFDTTITADVVLALCIVSVALTLAATKALKAKNKVSDNDKSKEQLKRELDGMREIIHATRVTAKSLNTIVIKLNSMFGRTAIKSQRLEVLRVREDVIQTLEDLDLLAEDNDMIFMEEKHIRERLDKLEIDFKPSCILNNEAY